MDNKSERCEMLEGQIERLKSDIDIFAGCLLSFENSNIQDMDILLSATEGKTRAERIVIRVKRQIERLRKENDALKKAKQKKKIFSGNYSIDMWDEINNAKTTAELRRALYTVCCHLQELEDEIKEDK